MGFLPGDLTPDKARLLMGRHSLHWIETGDQLKLSLYSGVASATVVVSGRVLSLDGRVTLFSQSIVIAAAGAQTAQYLRLDVGFLVDLEVSTATAAIGVGDIIAVVEIVQGEAGVSTPIAPLVAGYVATYQPLGVDDLLTSAPIGSVARYRQKAVSNPAAGANFTTTLPSGAEWEILSVGVTLVTAAVVATRQMVLQFLNGSTLIAQVSATSTQLISLTRVYLFTAEPGAELAVGTALYEPLPSPLRLPAGATVRSLVTLIDPGDQLSGILITAREYLHGG